MFDLSQPTTRRDLLRLPNPKPTEVAGNSNQLSSVNPDFIAFVNSPDAQGILAASGLTVEAAIAMWPEYQQTLIDSEQVINNSLHTQDVHTGNRRTFLGISLLGLGAGYTALRGMFGGNNQDKQTNTTTPQPTGTEVVNAPKVEGGHGVISKVDERTANFVAGLFGSVIGGQIVTDVMPEKVRVAGKEFRNPLPKIGLDEASSMALGMGWLIRTQELKADAERNPDPIQKEASKLAYEHELKESGNVVVAFALVGLAELASHIEYSPTSNTKVRETLYNNLVHTEKDKDPVITYEQFEKYLEVDPELEHSLKKSPPEVQAATLRGRMDHFVAGLKNEKQLDSYRDINSREEIEAAIAETKKEIGKKVMFMHYLGSIVAPFTTTYTSAAVSFNIAQDIAVENYKMEYLQAKLKNPQFDSANLETIANKKTRKMFNGPFGLANLILNTSANTAGFAFLGDPPGIFYLLAHGPGEWGINSLGLLLVGSGVNTGIYTAFLKGHGFEVNAETLGDPFKEAGAVFVNTIRSITLDKLAEIGKRTKNDPSTDPSINDLIDTVIATLNRPGTLTASDVSFIEFLKETAHVGAEMFYLKDLNGLRKDGLKYGKEIIGQVLDELRNATKFINEKYFDKDDRYGNIGKSMADYLRSQGVLEDKIVEIDRNINNIMDAVDQADYSNEEGINKLRQDLENEFNNGSAVGSFLNDINETSRARLKSQVNKYIDLKVKLHNKKQHTHDHSEDGHSHHHTSHAAKEVRDALLTQLWAVGSLQVVTKKALHLDDPNLKLDKEKFINLATQVSAIVLLTSGVADNVAAMLFGIDVLEDVGVKYFGEEIYNKNSEIGHVLRLIAFSLAVVGGSLSKFGNGPDMIIKLLDEVYRNDRSDILEAVMSDNSLARSMANPYSWLSGALYLLGSYGMLSAVANRYEVKGSEPVQNKEA